MPPFTTRVGQPRTWRPSFGAAHQNLPWVAEATLGSHHPSPCRTRATPVEHVPLPPSPSHRLHVALSTTCHSCRTPALPHRPLHRPDALSITCSSLSPSPVHHLACPAAPTSPSRRPLIDLLSTCLDPSITCRFCVAHVPTCRPRLALPSRLRRAARCAALPQPELGSRVRGAQVLVHSTKTFLGWLKPPLEATFLARVPFTTESFPPTYCSIRYQLYTRLRTLFSLHSDLT